ncbi:MAG: hypothetical protein AAF547_04730 [Actinomycetota bacterium]
MTEGADDQSMGPEPEGEFRLLPRTTPRHGGSILMAAMVGLANALGMDQERQEVEQVAEIGDRGGPDFDLSFGELPPLN